MKGWLEVPFPPRGGESQTRDGGHNDLVCLSECAFVGDPRKAFTKR